MADDLSDPWAEIRALKEAVRRLQAARPLENASITGGRVRFIGGLLRVDSGGSVEIVGSLQIDGTTTVTGTFTLTGNGWSITGDGTISGDVTITGDLEVNGPWTFNGNGTITGDVDLTGNINVNGSGRVNVGSAMTLTPATDGGAVEFPSGKLSAISGAVGLYAGAGGQVVLNTDAALIGPGSTFRAGSDPQITGLSPIASGSAGGLPSGAVWADGSGFLYRVT